jgi:hypothetical protein
MTIWGKSRSLLKVSKTDFHENKIIPRKYGMTCDKSILTLLCFLIYFCSSYSSSSSHGNRWPKSALTLTFSKVVNSIFALLWAVSVYDKRLLCILSIQNPENELWTWVTTKFPIIVVFFLFFREILASRTENPRTSLYVIFKSTKCAKLIN